jgi:small basic protein
VIILVIALAIGVLIGLVTNVAVPQEVLTYLGVAVLAALDSCFGGVRASLEGDFDDRVFLVGFVANTLVAALIVFLGDSIGVPELYLAAVVAFGVRLFNNLGAIRHLALKKVGWE